MPNKEQEETFNVTKFENVNGLLSDPKLYLTISNHLNGQVKQLNSICELKKTKGFSVFKHTA